MFVLVCFISFSGHAIHLPLSPENTFEYVQSTLPSTEFLNIIVDSMPTKFKNIIWRQIVNLPNVIIALNWLKVNNKHYKDIKINNDIESALIDSQLNNSSTEINNIIEPVEFIKSDSETSLLVHRNANYEIESNFTVQELKSNNNENAIEKYSMKHVESNIINERNKNLDHFCFPTLFPLGKGIKNFKVTIVTVKI